TMVRIPTGDASRAVTDAERCRVAAIVHGIRDQGQTSRKDAADHLRHNDPDVQQQRNQNATATCVRRNGMMVMMAVILAHADDGTPVHAMKPGLPTPPRYVSLQPSRTRLRWRRRSRATDPMVEPRKTRTAAAF